MLMKIEIGFIGGLLLQYGVPTIIGGILAYIPLSNVIKSLHKLIDDLIAANEDKKISQAEYDQLCADANELKSSLGGLISGIMLALKNKK